MVDFYIIKKNRNIDLNNMNDIKNLAIKKGLLQEQEINRLILEDI
jgi:hypothetical protein